MSRRTATLAFIGLAALVLAAAALAACGESEDPPDAVDTVPGRTVTTAAAVDVEPVEPESTTTEAPLVASEPDDAIEAGGLKWRRADLTAVGYDTMRIAEADDGFLALGYKIDEGEITTWSSQEGRSWTKIATDTEALMPGEFIMEVVATPTGFIATGGEAEWWWGEGPVDRMWTSGDGVQWTRGGFNLPADAPVSPFLKGEGSITGVARGPAGLVMVSSAIWMPNDQAILDEIAPGTEVDEIGMFGLGGVEPDGEIGFVYHDQQGNMIGSVSLSDLGLPPGIVDTLGAPTVGVWVSSDGSSWTPFSEATEWRNEERELSLAAGPNGYLIDGGDMLYLSSGGDSWTEIPAETAFGIPTGISEGHVTSWGGGWAAIVEAGMVPREGPVEGTDFFTEQKAILTSADGIEWAESVVPTSMLFSDERGSLNSLHGGEFGLFASVSPDNEDWEPSRGLFETELWWTTDAVTWDPIQVGPLFGTDRIVWDLAISTDRAVALVADWTGWQEAEEGTPAPLELWVASAQ